VGVRDLGHLKMSNFEQTITVTVCCFDHHWGIALSGPNSTPPGIIGFGGVVLSAVRSLEVLPADWRGSLVPYRLHR
jgi:hypothetical protein